ncbi:V-type proton ATPase subunit H [Termitomyces sp. T112]|nr:V-type proton ATPase subunit H [Termitomyces sp. T112]KAH0584116.1 hypothetical protein H2248_009685 [Termitomyces sp. 'cryptogamus']
MSISLVSNAYLDEASSKIRSKPVPWEGYQRADLITSEELALIKKVDKQPRARIEQILLSDLQIYAHLYFRLLKKLQRVDTMQCLLVLIADALSDHEERIPVFLRTAEADPDLPFLPLLRALDTQDEFVQLKASQILTILISSESTPLPLQYLKLFLATLASLVQGPAPNKRDVAVQCLESLLARRNCRQAIWAVPGIIAGFIEILKQKPGPQMSYQVAFCFWLLSFEQNVAEELDKKYDVIPLLIDVAQGAVKEKVIRVVVATFRNLVTKAPMANLPAMLAAKLLPFVKNLYTRKWQDEDILEDIQYLRDELNTNFQSLTTYDEYTSELSSGYLSWSPVHESDEFWKENASKLNDDDCKQLQILLRLLKQSTDPLILAVAVQDVGQYVKHTDRGKKLVEKYNGKARVMELMTHEDSEVRYRALIAVQQLVSQPWTAV